MHILHVIAGIDESSGGTTRVVADLTNSLAALNFLSVSINSQVVNKNRPPNWFLPNTNLSLTNYLTQKQLWLGLKGANEVKMTIKDRPISIMHIHGLWHLFNYWASRIAVQYDIPYIIHIHGMLEPWSMSWHSSKKFIAMISYQKKMLTRSSCLLATSIQEKNNIMALNLRVPVAVIPNTINVDQVISTDSKYFSKPQDRIRKALFMSRIHPKKGLMNLVLAWSKAKHEKWQLLIAGPDEVDHLSEVLEYARELGVEKDIQYVGVLDDKQKWLVYDKSDLFILPSFSENFGMVVVEALSRGVPVITTTGTPWSELPTQQCGWCVEPNVDALLSALNQALSLSDDERHEMGAKGLQYVLKFEPARVTQKMTTLYNWISGKVEKPDFVFLP